MQQMRRNIRKAVEIMEHLVRREQKKLNIAVREVSRARIHTSQLSQRQWLVSVHRPEVASRATSRSVWWLV